MSDDLGRGVIADGRAYEAWDSGATAYAVDLHLDMEPERELGPLSWQDLGQSLSSASQQRGGLAEWRAGMNAYWEGVSDDGVNRGGRSGFIEYAFGQAMRTLGNVGYDVLGLAAETALGFGLAKYGNYNVRPNVDTSPTFCTGSRPVSCAR